MSNSKLSDFEESTMKKLFEKNNNELFQDIGFTEPIMGRNV